MTVSDVTRRFLSTWFLFDVRSVLVARRLTPLLKLDLTLLISSVETLSFMWCSMD